MENYFVLIDNGFYYVSEHKASGSLTEAKKSKSIDELISTIPIMKDWNWDYKLGEIKNGELHVIADKEWLPKYYEWKDKNPDKHQELYSIDVI